MLSRPSHFPTSPHRSLPSLLITLQIFLCILCFLFSLLFYEREGIVFRHQIAMTSCRFLGPGCPKPIRRGSEECAKLFYTHYDRPDWAKVWIIQPGKPSKTGERQFLHPFFAQFFEREPEPQLKRAVTQSEADLRAQVARDVAECLKQKPVETKRAAKPVDAQQSVEV